MKKATKKTIEDNLQSKLDWMKGEHINEPTRFFKVGERVQIGSITESRILEILEGGKIYKVHKKHVQERHGETVVEEENDYWAWHELFPYITDKINSKRKEFARRDDVHIQYMNTGIGQLFCYYYGSGIDDEMDYQRGNVWKEDRKVSLIDSIFKNIDIGKFTLIDRGFHTEEKMYEMLDGKQRLNALIDFYEGRFKYKGKYFQDLNNADRSYFRDFAIGIGKTRILTKKEKYQYFLRLNTQGKTQDPKHILAVEKMFKKEK